MRLFVGIWPPEPVIGVLCDAQRRLAQRAPSGAVRLTRRDQLHLTLCFLGEVVAVRLMRSDLAPDGARYEQVAELPLRVCCSVGEG